jgi:hypothetical protein
MGIGVSVFLMAVGAILAFAVNVAVSGVDLAAIGWILMGVGAIGLIVALIALNGYGWGGGPRTTVVDDGYADPAPRRVMRRRTYVD